jgi:hypothetical protein
MPICGCSETTLYKLPPVHSILTRATTEGAFHPLNPQLKTRFDLDHTGRFEYLSPRIRLTPRDLTSTKLERPRILHFICSPSRASDIMSEVDMVKGWSPITIYEPIPVRKRFVTIVKLHRAHIQRTFRKKKTV